MIVGVPRESYPGERRVALVPAVVPTLAKGGFEVVVQAGAGIEAGYPDAAYEAKGAKIVADRAEVFRVADIVTQVLCYGSNDKTGEGGPRLVAAWPSSCGIFATARRIENNSADRRARSDRASRSN